MSKYTLNSSEQKKKAQFPVHRKIIYSKDSVGNIIKLKRRLQFLHQKLWKISILPANSIGFLFIRTLCSTDPWYHVSYEQSFVFSQIVESLEIRLNTYWIILKENSLTLLMLPFFILFFLQFILSFSLDA